MAGNVTVVSHGSPEYWAAVELRRQVLRLPLGLDFTSEELEAEHVQIHMAMLDGLTPMACLSLVPHGEEVKMRQVAVASEQQGKGLGRQLVTASETLAREKGFTKMVLHARETAVPFYKALGYAVLGEPFQEVGIPHRKMEKPL